MAYEISSYRSDRIICLRVVDALTIDELGVAIKFIEDAIRNASSTTHLIVDARETKSIPGNVLEIKKRITYLDRDKMGWIVLIGVNPLISTFIKVLTSLLGTKYQHFKSMKPALEFLMQRDESLGDLMETVAE